MNNLYPSNRKSDENIILGIEPENQIQETLYRSMDSKILKRKIEIAPYQWYDLKVKALQTGKSNSKLFSNIVVNCGSTFTKQFGMCVARNPAERCTFQDCSEENNKASSNSNLVYCPEETLSVELVLRNEEEGDVCKWKNSMTSAVAQISLYPLEGNFWLIHFVIALFVLGSSDLYSIMIYLWMFFSYLSNRKCLAYQPPEAWQHRKILFLCR